jgi:hypothetical protein
MFYILQITNVCQYALMATKGIIPHFNVIYVYWEPTVIKMFAILSAPSSIYKDTTSGRVCYLVDTH